MPRVYYKEEKIIGQAISNAIVNLDNFNYVLENKGELNSFDLTQKANTSLFKYIRIWDDGMNYNTADGNYYLPKSIIFYDVKDYNFPSEFYFISKIKSELEIRKANGGKEVKWFQIPDLQAEVKDHEIIKKIENSLQEVIALIKNKNSKTKIVKENKLQTLNEKQRKAYIKLAQLCLNLEQQNKIISFFNNLSNYDNDEDYESTLNFVMDYLGQNNIHFIFSLDWKAGVEDLEWRINSALKNNFNIEIKLPDVKNYKEINISSDGVFKDFDKSLRKDNFQIGLINTESDEYVMLIHKIEDKKDVEKAVNTIGYKYLEIK